MLIKIEGLTVVGEQCIINHYLDSRKRKNKVALAGLGVKQTMINKTLIISFGGVFGQLFKNKKFSKSGLLDDFMANVRSAFGEGGAVEGTDYKVVMSGEEE